MVNSSKNARGGSRVTFFEVVACSGDEDATSGVVNVVVPCSKTPSPRRSSSQVASTAKKLSNPILTPRSSWCALTHVTQERSRIGSITSLVGIARKNCTSVGEYRHFCFVPGKQEEQLLTSDQMFDETMRSCLLSPPFTPPPPPYSG